MPNRHVPLIIGGLCVAIAIWLLVALTGWWRFIPVTLLLALGWMSLKTAFLASDQELKEMTGTGPVSDDTRKKFQDRL